MCLDCNSYFLFEKQAFNGLVKVIGIQKSESQNFLDPGLAKP